MQAGNPLQDQASHPFSGIRPPADHGINRPDLHTWQQVQGTGTNRPKTYTHATTTPAAQTTAPHHQQHLNKVTAATATGKSPDPSRTRKRSLPAPMILPTRGER